LGDEACSHQVPHAALKPNGLHQQRRFGSHGECSDCKFGVCVCRRSISSSLRQISCGPSRQSSFHDTARHFRHYGRHGRHGSWLLAACMGGNAPGPPPLLHMTVVAEPVLTRRARSQIFDRGDHPLAAANKELSRRDVEDLKSWPTPDKIATFSKAPVPASARPGTAATLRSFFKTLHRFAPAFDVFVQQQPFVATLVWGSCRFLVQVRTRLTNRY
jgi:hypothetical protein